MKKGRTGKWGNIHPTLEIEMSIVKGPIREGGMREEGRTILEGRENLDDKGVRGCGGGNGGGEGEVKCIDNDRVRNNGGRVVVGGHINIILAEKDISRAHLRARGNYPFNVEILEKK